MGRLPALVILAALLAVGCGGGRDRPAPLPAPDPGARWSTLGGFAFQRPAGWPAERHGRGAELLIGYTGPGATAGVTPQVGLGVGRDYPDTLREAVRLLKDADRTAYHGYRVLSEGPVRIAGAQAWRIDSEYDAFVEERVKVRAIDILAQTPGRTQASFFARSAAPDFERAGLERMARSFRLR